MAGYSPPHLIGSVALGGRSIGVTNDGSSIWVAAFAKGQVARVDPNTRSVQWIAVPSAPTNVLFDHGSIWVTTYPDYISGNGGLSRIDPATNSVQSSVTGFTGPMGLVSDGSFLWVSNSGAGTVSKFDPTTNQIVATVRVGGNPQEMVFDGRFVWVTNDGSASVSKIDPALAQVVDTIAVGASPRVVAFDGTNVWVSSFAAGVLTKIDPATDAVLATLTVGGNPQGMTFDGSTMWLANYNGSVTQVNTAGGPTISAVSGLSTSTLMTILHGQIWVTNEATGLDQIALPSSNTQTAVGIQAYVHVLEDGTVDPAGSVNVSQANVTQPQRGLFCFSNLSFNPISVSATLGWWTHTGGFAIYAQADQGAASPWGCPSGTQAEVFISGLTSQATRDFYLWMF